MIIAALLLFSLGVAVIYSSSFEQAISQFIFGIFGLIFFFILWAFDYRALKSLIKPSYIVIFALLIVTLILGFETRGSVRWISFGPFNLQPSEFAKPVLILALATFWSKHQATWVNIGKSLLILLPFFIPVFEQPDLGTSMTLGFIWMGMLFAANISIFKMLLLSGLGISIIPLSWHFLETYQKQRITSFLSPQSDPQGIGFHVIQSQIAVGSGQLLGRGLGRGTQSRLQFLPEFRTDFIFAFIAEELGFIGSMLVLALYGIIFFMLFKLIGRVGDRFGELIIVGVASMLIVQITVNIGMNLGLLPITGITLPLLSYGGSSIITTFICLGLVASVSRFGLKRKEIESFGF